MVKGLAASVVQPISGTADRYDGWLSLFRLPPLAHPVQNGAPGKTCPEPIRRNDQHQNVGRLTSVPVMAYCTRAMRQRFLTGTPATFRGGACLRASQH